MQSAQPEFINSLSVTQPEYVYRNAVIVCQYTNVSSGSNLRAKFLTSMNALMKYSYKFDCEHKVIFLNFGYDRDFDKDFLRHMMSVDELEDKWQYDSDQIQDITNKTNASLDLIRDMQSELYESLHTIIGTFVYGKREGFGGGSISDVIGAIWLSPLPSWSVLDYAERIVHEYVHNCLFLDDMVNTIFTQTVSEMAIDDGLVTSTILKRKRGFDKSYHSAFVGTVLMQFYYKLNKSSKARSYLDAISCTIGELKSKPQFLTNHGQRILNELDEIVSKFHTDKGE